MGFHQLRPAGQPPARRRDRRPRRDLQRVGPCSCRRGGRQLHHRALRSSRGRQDRPARRPARHQHQRQLRDGCRLRRLRKHGLRHHRQSATHHVKVANNIVHDNVSNGIFLAEGDFFKVENNTVYGNSAKGASSGIHIKAAYNITGDMSDTNRVIVRNNVAYDNETKYGPDHRRQRHQHRRFPQHPDPELPAYTFRTLVEGNITYSNSGRGVQIAWSDYVTVRDNIAFHNSTLPISGPWRGDLANMGSNYTAWIGQHRRCRPERQPRQHGDRQRQFRRRSRERRRDLDRQHDLQRNPGRRPRSTPTTATTGLRRQPTSSASIPA